MYETLPSDLERLRSGRDDALSTETKDLLATSVARLALLRLFPVRVDLEGPQSGDAKAVLSLLADSLEDPSQAQAAWAILTADAHDVCARRLARNRHDLVELLAANGVIAKPLEKDYRWHRELDHTKQLLERGHPAAALALLRHFGPQLEASNVESLARYRLYTQYASASIKLDSHAEGLRFAQRALQHNPEGVHALALATTASLLLGNADAAREFSEKAVRVAPSDPIAWGARLEAEGILGDQPVKPPLAVAESVDYQTRVVEMAVYRQEWGRALEISRVLLTHATKRPVVLFFHATALVNATASGEIASTAGVFAEAEATATQLLDLLADDAHPLAARAYLIRAYARGRLGEDAGAEADLATARRLAADDPETIRHSANSRIESDDLDGALEVLHHPTVRDHAHLLTLRARVHALLDRDEEAKSDIEAALRIAAESPDPLFVRITAADVALSIDDIPLAQSALDGAAGSALADPRVQRVQGHISIMSGQIDEGIALFRAAADAAPAARTEALVELAVRLVEAGRAADAVKVFDEAQRFCDVPGADRFYLRALLAASEFTRAQKFLESLTESGVFPEWAIGAAIDLAFRREDVESAITHLTDLVERGRPSRYARLRLARLLIEREQTSAGKIQIDAALADERLESRERMMAAELLGRLGESARAMQEAIHAFRDRRHDPEMHRALIGLALWGTHDAPETTAAVQADTHVTMQSRGETRTYTVVASGIADASRGEITVDTAKDIGLFGLHVGEVLVQNRGAWDERRWTITTVVALSVYLVQDAMLHYEERFPGEPFFISGFKIGDDASPTDFAPMVASLEERKQHVTKVFRLYRERILPLGVVASMARASIPDTMDSITALGGSRELLLVEWADWEGQLESQSAASEAREVILTRSALHTVATVRILDLLCRFELVVPHSLLSELREELVLARDQLREGRKTVFSGPRGLVLDDVPPGDPLLQNALEEAETLARWVEKNAQAEYRPLARVRSADSRDEQAREILGRSSYDAFVLAEERRATLYADDLGLRQFLPKGSVARSFSTIGLIRSLGSARVIDNGTRDRLLLTLVRRNYTVIWPTPELLIAALRSAPEIGHEGVRKAFSLLAQPDMDLPSAARVACKVFKANAETLLQTFSVSELTVLALDTLATKWQPAACVRTLQRLAEHELVLLPAAVAAIRQSSREWLAKSLTIRT